jgi:exodeoxyribonuclease VII large subunit
MEADVIQRATLMFEHKQTVSEVTRYIRSLFELDETLQDVWITGEVSNMKVANSGHWYFTLKDNDAQLRCVMWRSSTSRQPVLPNDGDALEVHGRISLYEPRGEYQLYADRIRPVGVGDLYQRFEQLKAKLADEGLFDADRKRSWPAFPRKIGIVTSPTTAAFQDVLNVLRRRFPLAEVILSPTPVQGNEAPPHIIAALDRLNHHTDVDVIIMCRGGGSIEDLWSFNDEQVARAVAGSRIPVITGVGHEIDFTIVDFISDLRAPTPSAAAEQATPDLSEIQAALRLLSERLDGMMYDYLLNAENRLTLLERNLQRSSPQNTISSSRQRIDDLNGRLLRQQNAFTRLLRERLSSRTAALNAASPDALLKRGYAIVTRSDDGQRVTSELDASPGTGITIQLRDGELKARVEDKDTHGHYRRTLF